MRISRLTSHRGMHTRYVEVLSRVGKADTESGFESRTLSLWQGAMESAGAASTNNQHA